LIAFLAAMAIFGVCRWTGVGQKNGVRASAEEPGFDRNADRSRRERTSDATAGADEVARIRAELERVKPLQRGDFRNEDAITLLHRWAELEPQEAIEYANRHPECHGDTGLVAELFAGWLDRKSMAAETWFHDLLSGGLRNRMIPVMVSRLASESPEEALALAGELPGYDGELASLPESGRWNHSDEVDHQPREQAYATIFREWTSNDPLAAAGRAMGLEDPLSRRLALQEVAGKWSQKDLATAVRWAQELLPGPDRNSALEGIMTEWSTQDPRSVASFLLAMPAGSEREQWLKELGGNWGQREPTEAIAWAATLPQQKDQMETVCAVLTEIGKSSTRDAAEQALNLPRGMVRKAGLERILSGWAAKNPEEVKSWISQLPEASGQEMTEILSPR
jgi:hypothetical protein